MGPRANQHRRNVRSVAAFMEVVEIKSIVDHLIQVRRMERVFADLELEDEDD